MRILSQDENYDFPYENIVLEKMADSNTICAYTGTGQPFKIASYSSASRMDKAMEMLRKIYQTHFGYKTMTPEQQALLLAVASEKEQGYIHGIFAFPSDEEIEV